MDSDSLDRQTPQGLVLPWGWLSLALTIVTISALGTLAVVAKREGADTLSTIALALAVLSFSAQLIVSLAQAFNGTQQVAQADRVNADTRASLAAIRATSDALLVNQREQFSEVLHAALKIAVPAAVQDVEEAGTGGAAGDAEVQITEDAIKNLEERLSVRITEALRHVRTQSIPSSGVRNTGQAKIRMLSYPSETRGLELLDMLNKLSPQEIAVLNKWITRTLGIVNRRNTDSIPGIVQRGQIASDEKKLQELGLIDIVHRGSNEHSIRLTSLGIEMASLILQPGVKPSWLESEG